MQPADNKKESEKLEVWPKDGVGFPRLERNLGRRLRAACESIGQDTSVRAAERSWKQLQRYFDGAEPGAFVVAGICTAARVSLAYVIDGRIQVAADAELERTLIDEDFRAVQKRIEKEGRRTDLVDAETFLLRESQVYARLAALLIGKPRYERDYEHLIKPSRENWTAEIDADELRVVHDYYEFGADESHSESDTPRVPRYDLALAAGHGSFIDRAELLDHIPFTQAFLRRKLGRSSTDGLVMLDARGDSMEPTIGDGDLVMIDTRERDLQGGLMAFVLHDVAYIKRLRPLMAGGLEIVSDNAELYPAERLGQQDLADLQVIGRVRWVGKVL
ncbi:MAG: S24 family peptidase [Marivibrio sp.]|uniref:S24 family peptidase n=1 Tax=Marivibrio sp. TaxID=2039719 RepID=UPI0032EEAD62